MADETIFQDIERLSGGRVKVPAEVELTKISADSTFARPGMNLNYGNRNNNRNNRNRKNGKKKQQ